MPGTVPPYALAPFSFHFAALASYAGRAPLGGDRELAMGVLAASRLAHALLPPTALDPMQVAGRADRAKRWVMGLAMPNPARLALLRAFDATLAGPGATADALAEVVRTVQGHLDVAAQAEVDHLVAQLHLYYESTLQVSPLAVSAVVPQVPPIPQALPTASPHASPQSTPDLRAHEKNHETVKDTDGRS